VYDELAAAILELRILPGTLLSEPNLAEQLHVSRTPLREAIARLVETGLVSVVPQVGTLVEPIRLRDVEQARFVRETLESAAVAEACAKPVRDVAKLRELLAEQKSGLRNRDYDRFFRADEALHERIFELSGYPGAWQLMQPMKMQLERLRRLSLPDPKILKELIEEHTAIVDAVERGDARSARSLTGTHARRVSADAPGIRAAHPEFFVD
jgi:DNA-binding GntR family transcriptional regulator